VSGLDFAQQFLSTQRRRLLEMSLRQNGLPKLGAIWLFQAFCDRFWFALDHSTPSWDTADYLSGCLIYWQALQTAHWFSRDWWIELWHLSTKIPPLTYIVTTPFVSTFGTGIDQITLVLLLYSAVLLGSVYVLGSYLFTSSIGLWAAGLCVLLPTLYRLRLEFLLDYPVTAMVALCFAALTLWRGKPEKAKDRRQRAEGTAERAKGSGQQAEETAEGTAEKAEEKIFLSDLLSSTIRFLSSPARFLSSPAQLIAVARRLLLSASRILPSAVSYLLLPAVFGITLGLALMTKQTTAQFLLVPIAWALAEILWGRRWGKLAQFGLAMAAALVIAYPWYRTNWLLILTSSKKATIDSAIAEGAPPLVSLKSLFFYGMALPEMVSWVLLVPAGLGLLFFWRRSRVSSLYRSPHHGIDNGIDDYAPKSRDYRWQKYAESQQALNWLLVFLVGAYCLTTLNPNKDNRYIAPYLPVLAIGLAYGLVLLPKAWRLVRWGAIAAALLLMLSTLFPLFATANNRNPTGSHFPDQTALYPHAEVIAEVLQTAPFLQSTIGVLPSTPQLNQHNINYYGLLQNFQVYGRQVGTQIKDVEHDRRSLPFFLTKAGDQGSIRKPEPQAKLVQSIQQGKDFTTQKTWNLPDGSTLQLHRRTIPFVEVKRSEAIKPGETAADPSLKLTTLTLPAQAPPGKPIPVTYEWAGSWEILRSRVLLLTWRKQGETPSKHHWMHDHAIAMGTLHPAQPRQGNATSQFQVVERMAMLPPASTAPGTYGLEAMALEPSTGKIEAIAVPRVTLQIDPAAPAVPAPELDLITQFRELAKTLPQGTKIMDRVFAEIGRINQYDPNQDYVRQVQQATAYRLTQEPNSLNLLYTMAFTTILNRQVEPAIATLQRITKLTPKNPNPYAYLAFVNLYDFRPHAAARSLQQVKSLNPALPELNALNAVTALMQGNLIKAWQDFQAFQKSP
jgi:4-amino-4-deoxy-L-arabinose transferase-like glycosyltransferase